MAQYAALADLASKWHVSHDRYVAMGPSELYYAIRHWVDRQWRAPGQQSKVLLLPIAIPFLAIAMIGWSPGFGAIALGWCALWTGFVFWRGWLYFKEACREGDRRFDRQGKFRLGREYHDTESATAAAEKKRRKP